MVRLVWAKRSLRTCSPNTLVYLLAVVSSLTLSWDLAGYKPVEINASDDRTAGVLKEKIRDATGARHEGSDKS